MQIMDNVKLILDTKNLFCSVAYFSTRTSTNKIEIKAFQNMHKFFLHYHNKILFQKYMAYTRKKKHESKVLRNEMS